MKTLINKANPQIRITAPEIESYREFYTLPDKDFHHHLFKMETWTLVEEEPTEGIKENLEEIPSNVDLEKEIDRLWDDFSDEISGPHNKFDIYARVARHFYELGRKVRKEE